MKILKPMHFDQSGKIALTINHRLEMIDMNRILYCSADGNYSEIHLTDKTTYMTSESLKYVGQKLKEFGFFAIDKSFVVNILLIKSITQERNAKLLLDNGVELKISRNRKSELMDFLF